ncbi:MAG: hypothetical protein J6X46_03160 [Prevotella sp.]|nr:hypothetical protein [Prevotella sp.]
MRSVYKLFVPLFLTLGLVACGDSSSSADPDTVRCVVKKENPLVMESSFNGVVSKTTVELRDGKMIQTVESTNSLVIDENCKTLKGDSDYGEVLCDAESVVAISREKMSESFFEKFKKTFKEACESADDTKIKTRKDLDSLENTLDSLERTLSSSSKGEDQPNFDATSSSGSIEPVFSCTLSKSGDVALMSLTSNGVTYEHAATIEKGMVVINSTATSGNKMLVAGICSMQQGSGTAKEAVCTDTQVYYKTELDIHVSDIDDVVDMFQQECDEQSQYYGYGEAFPTSAQASTFNGELETFTDSRDGEVYTQVQIGDQLWMGQNLRYADSSSQGTENLKGATWCLDNEPENCKTAGALYLWTAAMDVPITTCGHGKICGITEFPHQGICPKNWHVPTQEEWQKLQDYVGGESGQGMSKGLDLMAQNESGSSKDKYGFGAVPTGEYDFRSGSTHRFSSYGAVHYWSATESDSKGDGAYTWYINGSTFSNQRFDKNMGYAVRCIHD